MQLLQSLDHLGKVLRRFLKRKHLPLLILKDLQVHKISSIAVLHQHVVELVVFLDIVELHHMFPSHLPHALDLPLEVLDHIFILPLEFFLVDHLQGHGQSLFIFNQEDISEGPFAQFPLVDVFVQELGPCGLGPLHFLLNIV